MKSLTEQLSQYAAYHRDRRNIATHFVGIPLIVLAIATLLARPHFLLGGVPVSPATLATLAVVAYYLRLDRGLGLAMAGANGAALGLAMAVVARGDDLWWQLGLSCFGVGWVFQLVGHVFEGRKPAFVDDLMGLIIGPLFVVAELGFLLGWRGELRLGIEAQAGATR